MAKSATKPRVKTARKPKTSAQTRTIFTGDNLPVMRGMNSGSVDLIYLDPPFNSNKKWQAPVGSKAAGAAFKDTWTLSDLDLAEVGLLAEAEPALADFVRAAQQVHGDSMMSYLTMMAVRLIEMRRILKSEGSIYLHCDDTAGHYLKVLMDSIFGKDKFRNEITWKRTSAHGNAKFYGRVSDTILFYTAAEGMNGVTVPLDPEYVAKNYRHEDARGRYQLDNLTSGNAVGGESTTAWRGVLPPKGRGWSAPLKGAYAKWLFAHLPDGYENEPSVHARLDMLDDAGFIKWPADGGIPRLKRYLRPGQGQKIGDNWTDIAPVGAKAAERCGYPTQKPVALMERIIKASTNPGDLVLDPFCGCATTCIAAEKTGREWIGIDLSEKANELVRGRVGKELGLMQQLVTHRRDIPKRTDLGPVPPPRANKHQLYGEQTGLCAGCGCHFEFRHLEVDHIVPQHDGGSDHIVNLQLLCGHCNRVKGTGTMAELSARLAELGVLR